MFTITAGKGFHIEFKNGWKVSVQFGPGNYCDHYNVSTLGWTPGDYVRSSRLCGETGSTTAEIWCFPPPGSARPDWAQDPQGYQTPEQFLEYINRVAKQE